MPIDPVDAQTNINNPSIVPSSLKINTQSVIVIWQVYWIKRIDMDAIKLPVKFTIKIRRKMYNSIIRLSLLPQLSISLGRTVFLLYYLPMPSSNHCRKKKKKKI